MKMRLGFPPSVNSYMAVVNGRKVKTKKHREYLDAHIWDSPKKSIEGPVRVVYEATYPDGRRRDIDNLLKPLNDLLQSMGVVHDDSQIVDLRIRKIGVEKPGWIDATITRVTQ